MIGKILQVHTWFSWSKVRTQPYTKETMTHNLVQGDLYTRLTYILTEIMDELSAHENYSMSRFLWPFHTTFTLIAKILLL